MFHLAQTVMKTYFLSGFQNNTRSASSAVGIILVTGLVIILSAVTIAAFYGIADDFGEPEQIASAGQCGVTEFDPGNVDAFADEEDAVFDVPCVMRFDASQLDYNDGETVNEWPDQSANELDAVAEGDPEFNSDVSGVPSVVFDSSDNERFLTDVNPQDIGLDGNTEQAYTIVIRDRTGSDRGGFFAMGQAGNPDGSEFSFTSDASENDWVVQNWGANAADIRFSLDRSYESWMVFTVTYDGDKTTVYANGETIDSNPHTLNTDDTGQIKLGEWDGNYLDGEIAEVIVFDHHLDNTDREEVECTIDKKYGGAVSVRGC